MSVTPILQAKGLMKRYGTVVAMSGADFELMPGEILAVIGDNGAGKSTLIKALSGAVVPDHGEILLDGRVVRFRNPMDARREGIECCYQDLAVAPAMTIAENLFLGREIRREGFLGDLLSGAEVGHDAHEAGDQARRLDPPQGGDRLVDGVAISVAARQVA